MADAGGDEGQLDETFRGTTTEVKHSLFNSEFSATERDSEANPELLAYHLEMQPIACSSSKEVRADMHQVWFFRYDCIVNQACPNVAL